MHRHYAKATELTKLLLQFENGEFILKQGRGRDTPVFTGKIERLEIPNISETKVQVHPHSLYERWLGRDNFSERRWRSIELHIIEFNYTWFYPQPRHSRLKLQAWRERKDVDGTIVKDTKGNAVIEIDERLWLCSYTDPIYLDVFRAQLLKKFYEESVSKPKTFLQRIRDKIVRG
ncbi:MAG: hypothetical protein Q7R64_04125 [bacterium]|nr:hypothetical protein [bacterium]